MKFEELDDRAKDKVRELMEPHDTWWEFIDEEAKEDGKALGFDISTIYWSGFWSQGDGASWKGVINLTKWLAAHVQENKKYAILCALTECNYVEIPYPSVYAAGQYCHEYTMGITEEPYIAFEDLTQTGVIESSHFPLLNGVPASGLLQQVTEEDMRDLAAALLESARDYARGIYEQLEAEYEYLTSDECIAEQCEANEYEFDETGELT